jgi:hypothetical protein
MQMLAKLIDVQLPFFIPLWRRVAVVVLCFGWAIVEAINGAAFWAVLFGALGVYCSWQFFFAFDPKVDSRKGPTK